MPSRLPLPLLLIAITITTTSSLNQRSESLRDFWSRLVQAYDDSVSDSIIPRIKRPDALLSPLQQRAARDRIDTFLNSAPYYPGHELYTSHPAIVSTGGGFQLNLFYANAKLLRHYGCTLPIEIWSSYEGDGVPSPAMTDLFQRINVTLHNLDLVVPHNAALLPGMRLQGLRGKPYLLKHMAILSATCTECIFLDMDNIAVRDVAYLFETEQYKQSGMLLWVREGDYVQIELFKISCNQPLFQSSPTIGT